LNKGNGARLEAHVGLAAHVAAICAQPSRAAAMTPSRSCHGQPGRL